ncbi:MAG: phage tail tube protein [Bacteroidia bacterium]|jgi:hypothetical protein
MATTGVVNGSLVKLKLTGSAVAYLTTNDLNIANALRDTTNKDSAWASFLGGLLSGNFSWELLHVEDGTEGFDTAFASITGGTVIAFDITSGVSGDKHYSGNMLFETLKISYPMNQNAVVSGSAKVTGAITEGTV